MRRVAHYTLAYLLWLVTGALALLASWVFRSTYVLLMGAALANPNLTSTQLYNATLQSNALDRFALVFLGLVVLIVIIAVETYYRVGVSRGRLLRNFLLVTAIELGVLGLCHTVTLLVAARAGVVSLIAVLLPLGELLLVGGFAWLRRKGVDLPAAAVGEVR